MQTFQIEVSDNIADKVLDLLKSFSELKIKKLQPNLEEKQVDSIVSTLTRSLEEVKKTKKENKNLQNAWELLDDL